MKVKGRYLYWYKGRWVTRQRKHELKYPQKFYAQMATREAVKWGLIKRGLCEVCGISKTQAHHVTYTPPLKIRWLCAKHHREEHGRKPGARK